MKNNIRHYVRTHPLSASDRFRPLFEAVDNAFDAIEESGRRDGHIKIVIHRDTVQADIGDGEDDGARVSLPEVTQFEIIDNGIGFTANNWEAFQTVNTDRKASRNGKGVGRLSYLAAFREAEIESHFDENGQVFHRHFVLRPTDEGIEEETCEPSEGADTQTIVALKGFFSQFRKLGPRAPEKIAQRIVRHFFSRLSVPGGPSCILCDTWQDTPPIDLRDYFQTRFILETIRRPISVGGTKLRVVHARCRKEVADKHEVLLCAKDRVVEAHALSPTVTATKGALHVGEQPFYYVAFVSGELLDEKVNTERTGFSLPADDEEQPLLSDPSVAAILAATAKSAQEYLSTVLEPLREQHATRIKKFCAGNVALRPLWHHREEELRAIPIGISDVELEAAIWRIYHSWRADVRSRISQFTRTVRENADALRDFQTSYRGLLREMSELAFHELASYVVDRKAVIEFLDSHLAQDANGRFRDENAIHDVFFPRHRSSDDIAWDESNLWLIDERLVFQQFIASDKPLSSHDPLPVGDAQRPDVACYYARPFDQAFAFSEDERPFGSITLIEFKKPERDDYSEEENPISQAFRYIERIESEEAFTVGNHRFRTRNNAPYFVYIICHLTEKLRRFASRYGAIPTDDGEGLIFYNPDSRAYFQIISFEKLIADAKKRNRIFFERLGLE